MTRWSWSFTFRPHKQSNSW